MTQPQPIDRARAARLLIAGLDHDGERITAIIREAIDAHPGELELTIAALAVDFADILARASGESFLRKFADVIILGAGQVEDEQ